MVNITENEAKLLQAIRDSQYHDGRDPVGDDVWVDDVCDEFGRSAGGIMASLVTKKLAWTTGESCAITQAGFDAISTA